MKTFAQTCKERAEKATEGPWWKGSWSGRCFDKHVHSRGECNYIHTKEHDTNCVSLPKENHELIGYDENGTILSEENAEFIAHARTDVPELCRRLDRACELLNTIYEGCALDREELIEIRETIKDLEAMPEGK